MALVVKNPPAMQKTQETGVRPLGREVGEVLPGVGNGNPFWYSCLEEASGGLQAMGRKE